MKAWFFSLFLIISMLLGLLFPLHAQQLLPKRKIHPPDKSNRLDSLHQVVKDYVTFVNLYNAQIISALQYFPSLQHVHIRFKYARIPTTMQCLPTVWSVIFKPSQRSYTIKINNNKKFSGVLLQDVPFNAQIGVIGHELSHVLDFESRRKSGLLFRSIEYLSGKGKRKFEQSIDSLTIVQGLGWQLYDWEDFVLNQSKASMKYKEFKRRTYLSPEKIKALMRKDRKYGMVNSE